MQYLTIKNFLAAVVFAALGSSQLIANGTLTWSNDAKNITLYGNATEVMAQLKVIDPYWTPKVASPVSIFNATGSGADLNATEVSDFSVKSREGLICCPVPGEDFKREFVEYIEIAAGQLARLGGYYKIGSNACAVVNEYYGAGIWLCAAGSPPGVETISVELNTIANYAASIATGCPTTWSSTCGQLFDTDHFNVVISSWKSEGNP